VTSLSGLSPLFEDERGYRLERAAAGGNADLFAFKLLKILNLRLGDQIEGRFGRDHRNQFHRNTARRGR
jgi:hypothetical protein